MTSHYLLVAIFAMAVVTFITRAIPALIPQGILDTPWLHRLNESLPLSVMVLLILTSLSYQNISFNIASPEGHLLLAQLGALGLVLLVYHLTKQLLVSMVAGIAALNALLWLLS